MTSWKSAPQPSAIVIRRDSRPAPLACDAARARSFAVIDEPNVKMSVARKRSHGMSFTNVVSLVFRRRAAPRTPPTKLAAPSAITCAGDCFISSRYAKTLATPAGHSATEFVAFAATGGTPVKRSAGKLTKLPPPATELIAPATAAAKKRRVEEAIVT